MTFFTSFRLRWVLFNSLASRKGGRRGGGGDLGDRSVTKREAHDANFSKMGPATMFIRFPGYKRTCLMLLFSVKLCLFSFEIDFSSSLSYPHTVTGSFGGSRSVTRIFAS